MTTLVKLTIHTNETFSALKSKQKKEYFDAVMARAKAGFDEAYARRSSETSGSAFLWVSLYGKDAISRAFRAFIKKHHERRIMSNYRGTKHAWYFGSQTSHGYWDGLRKMCEVLTEHGIDCYTCDEWD
jgi:hypothetical protein